MSCCCGDNIVYKGETLVIDLSLFEDDGVTPITFGEYDDLWVMFSGQPAGSVTTCYKLSSSTITYNSTTGVATLTVLPTETVKLDGTCRIEIKVIKDGAVLIGTKTAFECVDDNIRSC